MVAPATTATTPTTNTSATARSASTSTSVREIESRTTTSESVTGWDVFALSRRMRERGWQVPAYTFPEHREDLAVLRIVVRNGFSQDMAHLFFQELKGAVQSLNEESTSAAMSGPSGFRH